jgi:hypothetical protein
MAGKTLPAAVLAAVGAAADQVSYLPPDQWGRWVVFLLERLEIDGNPSDRDNGLPFDAILRDLQAAIAGRLEDGTW